MAKKKRPTGNPKGKTLPPSNGNLPLNDPEFGEVQPSPDPTQNKIQHPYDTALYGKVNKHLLQPIPTPLRPKDLVLTLERTYGKTGPAKVNAIRSSGQIVFHA